MVGQIRDHKAALGVLDDSAQRHLDDEILGIFAVAEACPALAALIGGVFALVAEIHQGGEVVVHDEDDITAAAAIAAVRAARGHEFFTMEADRAVAALARMEPDGGDVDKVGLCCHTAPPVLKKGLFLLDLAPISGELDAPERGLRGFMFQSEKAVFIKKSRALKVRLFGLQILERSYCFTLHFLPLLPTRSKRTVPSTRANRVSSLPLPTFSPG